MSTVTATDAIRIVLQEAPYGNEKAWNALRLSQGLLSAGSRVRIFLYADSVLAAKKGQSTPSLPRAITISEIC